MIFWPGFRAGPSVWNLAAALILNQDLGEGTTFTILLPAAAIASQAQEEKNLAIVTGQGRVLVMERLEGVASSGHGMRT